MTAVHIRRGRASRAWSGMAAAAALAGVFGPGAFAAPGTPKIDYLTAPFRQERILGWGDRPDWSPDGRRIVFTKDDLVDGPAYEIDVATRKVRCITCRFGKTQFVTRIFYLPDDSFLIEAAPGMAGGTGGGADALRTELFWMSRTLDRPVPLGSGAMGDIAIARAANPDGSVNLAWARPKGRGLHLVTGKLTRDAKGVRLADIGELYDYQPGQPGEPTFPEAYEFVDGGRSVMFWTVEATSLDGEMYKVGLASNKVAKVYATPAHNETHLFPDERYGLEESNLLSDPDGRFRGISALGKAAVELMLRMRSEPDAAALAAANSDKGFDLAVVTMDGKSRRALTAMGASGAQAHQSIVAPDGRRIAFAIKDPTGHSGHAPGLYVGTFGSPGRR